MTSAAALRTICAALFVSFAHAAPASPLEVDVTNLSEPTACAETDNVSIALTSDKVRSFRVTASHPSYLPDIKKDSFAPDWTSCDMSRDPAFKTPAPPRRMTLYEDLDTWLVAWTFPSFWRPATATVRVGDRVERNIHMIQLWVRRPNGGEEIAVFYPQDGYWRLRPRSPMGYDLTAFGSSFLIGPVEQDGRPVVRVGEVAFDPAAKIFSISFVRGGAATVTVLTESKEQAFDVTFDVPVSGAPFAMLRSMYITDTNNDTARIATQKADGSRREDGIMDFRKGQASSIWTGRTAPSTHNTSSPDMTFGRFSERSP